MKGARERQMSGEGGGGEEAVKGARERQMRGEGGEEVARARVSGMGEAE